MADHDNIASITPQLPAVNKRAANAGRPTVANLKTALTAFNSTSYSPARLQAMTHNDLVAAARLHGLSVTVTF